MSEPSSDEQMLGEDLTDSSDNIISNPVLSGAQPRVSGYLEHVQPQSSFHIPNSAGGATQAADGSHGLDHSFSGLSLEDTMSRDDPSLVQSLSRVFEGQDLRTILDVYYEVEALTEKTNLNEIMMRQIASKFNELNARVKQMEREQNGNSGASSSAGNSQPQQVQMDRSSSPSSSRRQQESEGNSKVKAGMLKEVDDAVTVLCNELLLLQSTIEAHKMQNSRDRDTYEKRILDLQLKITEKKHRMRTDGKFTWRINDYARTLRAQKGTEDVEKMSMVSQHFQTPSGHEFRLRVFLNGTGKGKNNFLSMFIQCYRSEYDDILEYPFHAVIVFRVFDQSARPEKKHHKLMFRTNNSPCFQRPGRTQEYTPENGLAQLLSHELINKIPDSPTDGPRYLDNDTIFVGCEILQNA